MLKKAQVVIRGYVRVKASEDLPILMPYVWKDDTGVIAINPTQHAVPCSWDIVEEVIEPGEPHVNMVEIMELVIKDANDKEEAAGYGGTISNAARTLKEQVKFYRHGMKNEMPEEWNGYKLQLDPEFEEWERLRKKFGKL